MEGVFRERTQLTVVAGRGYLSSFEVSTLRVGDVVRTSTRAGKPHTILLGGEGVGAGEIVILGDVPAVRIVSLGVERERPLYPGVKVELTEFLPTQVNLGAIRLSFAELRGVAVGTFVSLGREFSSSEDAELVVGGVPAAAGKVVLVEEEMGIRLTQVYGRSVAERTVRSSGYLFRRGASAARSVDYDFRTPDRFSKAVIFKMASIHSSFVQNLKAALPEDAAGLPDEIEAGAVDQQRYGEALASLRDRGESEELEVRTLFAGIAAERSLSAGRGTRRPRAAVVVEEESPARRIPRDIVSLLTEMTGSDGMIGGRIVVILSRSSGAFHGILQSESGRDTLLSCLRGAWKNLADLNLSEQTQDGPVEKSVYVPEYEMVVTVAVERPGGEGPELMVVYPFTTLEPYVGILGEVT